MTITVQCQTHVNETQSPDFCEAPHGGLPAGEPVLPTDGLKILEEIGAGEAIRTPDPNLGKVMLYP